MKNRNLEDIYPLSPLQESLLYHLLALPGSAVGFEQKSTILRGELDLDAFAEAWRQVVRRHPTLRTVFVWEGLARPMQVVCKRVELALERHDWSASSTDRQVTDLEAFLDADQRRGFDLRRAPLMRLALIDLGEQTWRLVWSYHHLLIDAWCRSLVLDEVAALYSGLRVGQQPTLPPRRPFRDYMAWLARQDEAAAAAFWRRSLAAVGEPTRLRLEGVDPAVDREVGYQGRDRYLASECSAVVGAGAKRLGITLGSLVQGAWAILLGRYSGLSKVIFGATVSGRPPDLPGVENLVGMLINNLPVALQIDDAQPVGGWLSELQRQVAELRTYQHCSPAQILEWSGRPAGQRLFDTLLLFQNAPQDSLGEPADDDSAAGSAAAELEISDYRSRLETGYPLTLVVVPGERMLLRAFFDASRYSATAMERLLGHLENLLVGLIGDPKRPLGELEMLWPEEQQWLLQDCESGLGDFGRLDRAYLLDDLRRPVAAGLPGDLWLAGSGVVPVPEGTAVAPDPFRESPTAQMWQSGYSARRLAAGELETLGPSQRRVEVAGQRIRVGEIEAALRRDPEVGEVLVKRWRTARGVDYWLAYVEPAPAAGLDVPRLRQTAERLLPRHLLPAFFVELTPLPRDSAGRLDEDRLPAPESLTDRLHAGFVPPETPLQLRLVRIWEETFGLTPIGIRDDFFALGGHSALAVLLMTRIRAEFGDLLPLNALLEAGTVERLAGVIGRPAEDREPSSLVAIQAAGSRTPLFVVHPGGGGVLCYTDLAYCLGADQPVLGLQAPGWADSRAPFTTVEELAELYVELIHHRLPDGPYRLAGWSFGGLVAYEVALRLADAGQPPDLLAVLDAGRRDEVEVLSESEILMRFLESVPRLAEQLSASELAAIGDLDAQIAHALAIARQNGVLPPHFDVEEARRLFTVRRACIRAAEVYLPGNLDGSIELFVSREFRDGFGDPELGWRSWVEGEIVVHELDSSHAEMVQRPWIEGLAKILGSRLRDLEQQTGGRVDQQLIVAGSSKKRGVRD